jgi:hypothetical protein
LASASPAAANSALEISPSWLASMAAKAGRYTVHIKASREHGTYQVSRQEMEFAATAARVQLPGNTEIASITLDYRKGDR